MKEFLTYAIEAGPIRAVVWEVLYVIGLILVLSVVLDRLMFRPVMRVLDERARRLQLAAGSQEGSLQRLEDGAREQTERIAAGHRDAAARIDEAKRTAEAARHERIAETRAAAELRLTEARTRVAGEAEAAGKAIAAEAEDIARKLASKLLGRDVA